MAATTTQIICFHVFPGTQFKEDTGKPSMPVACSILTVKLQAYLHVRPGFETSWQTLQSTAYIAAKLSALAV